MEQRIVALLAGVAFVAFAAAVLHGAARMLRQVPAEDRAHLDPLPRGLRMLWPLLRVIDHHVCQRLPGRFLNGPAESLRLSGMLYLMSPTQFLALCLVGMGGFAALASVALALAGIDSGLAVLAAGAFGFAYPRVWLKDALNKRRRQIVRALPVYLDFLTMGVEAGLNVAGAMTQAVAKGPAGPLKNEFAFVLRDLRAGLTRADALRRLDERVRIPQVTRFVSAVVQAERMGASLGPTFRNQAEQRRVERFQAAEKLALEAPVKLIFPLVVFIFPTTFLVLMFPIAVKFMQSGAF
jgi:tight adherence protein C